MVKREIRKEEYRFVFVINYEEIFDILYIYKFEKYKHPNLKTLRKTCQ